MTWQLPPSAKKAREFIARSTAPINIAHGPVRCGKTVAVNLRWFEYCAREAPEGGDLLMVGKTERTLVRNVLQPMQDELGVAAVRINRGEGTATIAGRRVYLVGANDERSEQKIRGMTVAGANTDEITLYPEGFWDMLLTRLSVEGSKLFGSTNPGPPRHYLKKKFLDRGAEVGVRGFPFKLDDNPFLSEEFKARLKAQFTGVFYKRMILGQWVAAEGAIYDMFDEDVHVVDAAPQDLTTFAVGGDYGASNATCFLLLGYGGRDGRLWVLDAFYYDGGAAREASGDPGAVGLIQTDDERVRALERLTAPLATASRYDNAVRFRYPVVLDPSALTLAETARRRGFDVHPANNDVINGIGLVANLIAADRLRIVRTPATEHLVDDLTSYVWDPKQQVLGIDAPVKKADHAADALRYPVATLPALVQLALSPPGLYVPEKARVMT